MVLIEFAMRVIYRDIKLWDVIVNASHVHPDDIQKEVVFIWECLDMLYGAMLFGDMTIIFLS